jgi:hypothetical protein
MQKVRDGGTSPAHRVHGGVGSVGVVYEGGAKRRKQREEQGKDGVVDGLASVLSF